ncbi:MAG: hypothetical protein OGMRLDGQ_002902 [Candidatus Fervidibacter sp.]
MSTALQKTTRPSLFATRCCFTIRQSLIAIHFRFTSRHSLFAIRYSLPFFSRLADLPTCRFADKFWLGRSLALPQF